MNKVLLLAIMIPAAVVLIIITKVVLRPERVVEPHYVEFDPDKNVVARKKSITDGLEEDK